MVLSAPVATAISREIFLLIDNQTPFKPWPSFNESPIDFCLTMSAPGILAQWQAARQVIVVPMGDVQFVTFQQMPAIGTRDLGSCSVVVLASAYGAILAHIPPQPARPSADPMAGDNNVRSMMDRVATLYERNKTYLNPFGRHGCHLCLVPGGCGITRSNEYHGEGTSTNGTPTGHQDLPCSWKSESSWPGDGNCYRRG